MSDAAGRATLERLLADPGLGWLLARVRARVLTANGEPLHGVVVLARPTAAQREAAVRLLGRPARTGSSLRIDLADVELLLRRGPWPAGLADAVQTLGGPVLDRSAERAREAAVWAHAHTGLTGPSRRFSNLSDWWAGWCAAGGLKRAAQAEAKRTGSEPGPAVGAHLVAGLVAVLDALPASGEPLAVLARRVLGDSHALDESRPLGRMAVAALRAAFGSGPMSAPMSAREAWAAAGVLMSSLASMVLALGVGGRCELGDPPLAVATAAMLEAMRTARAPTVLTLDQVRSGGVAPLPRDAVVQVCENPTVVEVVARRLAIGPQVRAVALVCTWGQASTAVVELLALLTAEGASCRYHGDFDWAGLRIASALQARVRWQPWRFTAVDYIAATSADVRSLALRGTPADSPWDPELAAEMARRGLAVEEEAVVELLVSDVLELSTGTAATDEGPVGAAPEF